VVWAVLELSSASSGSDISSGQKRKSSSEICVVEVRFKKIIVAIIFL
jgi:hypothetical protein